MMLYEQKFFFVTKRAYTYLDTSNFNLEITKFILKISPNHDELSSFTKLEFLINYLNQNLSAEFFLSLEDLERFKQGLLLFLESRRNSYQSQFVLSVTQSVTYLEELIFDLFNTIPTYEFRLHEKKGLCSAIIDIFTVCDTGLSIGFCQALSQYKRSNDWVSAALEEMRLHTLNLINQHFDPHNVQSSHTFAYILTLAEKAKLGVRNTSTQSDPYEYLQRRKTLAPFFKKKYSTYFIANYELPLLENLLYHLLCALKSCPTEIGWDEAYLQVSSRDIEILTVFFDQHFQKNADGLLNEILIFDETSNTIVIKDINQIKLILKPILMRYLEERGFIISYENALIHPSLQQQIETFDGLSFVDFQRFKDAAAKEDVAGLLKQPKLFSHVDFITWVLYCYPLSSNYLAQHFAKNPDFRQVIDKIFEQDLKHSLGQISNKSYQQLHEFDFLKLQPSSIYHFKQQIHFPFYLGKYIQSQLDIMTCDYDALKRHMLQTYPDFFNDKQALYQQPSLNKYHALEFARHLLENPEIEHDLFLNNIAFIDPKLFAYIYKQRKQNNLPLLYACRSLDFETKFESFMLVFNRLNQFKVPAYNSYHHYFDLKLMMHHASIDFNYSSDIDSILIHDDWFRAFLEISRDEVEPELLKKISFVVEMMGEFWLSCQYMAIVIVFLVFNFYGSLPLNILFLSFNLIYYLTRLLDLNFVLLQDFRFSLIQSTLKIVDLIKTEILNFFHGLACLFNTLFKLANFTHELFSDFLVFCKLVYIDATLPIQLRDEHYQCINTLLLSNIGSERQKGKILEQLYFQIKVDSPNFELVFLDKTYAFRFESKRYQMSFNQVMACPCLENEPLILKKSFFSSIFSFNSSESLSSSIVDSPDSPYDIQVMI